MQQRTLFTLMCISMFVFSNSIWAADLKKVVKWFSGSNAIPAPVHNPFEPRFALRPDVSSVPTESSSLSLKQKLESPCRDVRLSGRAQLSQAVDTMHETPLTHEQIVLAFTYADKLHIPTEGKVDLIHMLQACTADSTEVAKYKAALAEQLYSEQRNVSLLTMSYLCAGVLLGGAPAIIAGMVSVYNIVRLYELRELQSSSVSTDTKDKMA